jgi:hypothetical protein
MVPENKQNRRIKQINFIGLQNNRHPSQYTVGNVHKADLAPAGTKSGEYGGLLSVSPPEETFADVAAIQECVTAVLQSIPKENFADSFQKLYERCQQCVVKDGDYVEGQ